MARKYSFLQISDLHFGNTTSIYDRDADLRNELKIDVQRMVRQYHLKIDGILICGDIAFSGKAEEYREAECFIEMLREMLSVEIDKVCCVPGNHDVDQSVSKRSVVIYALQKLLQNASAEEQLIFLEKLRQEKEQSKEDYLFQPLRQYNEFAKKHNGGVGISNPYTDCIFELEDGYQLIIHGMNSTLISNAEDHNWKNQSEKKMVLERTQIPQSADKSIYLTLCHHPVECWSDEGDQLNTLLNNRVMIQLFGHTHQQSIFNHPKYIRVISGALQPPNRWSDDWNAQYNMITVEYNAGNLNVTIYPRILDDTRSSFQASKAECAEGMECVTYTYPLQNSEPEIQEAVKQEKGSTCEKKDADNYNKKRSFIIEFYHLTPRQQELFIRENCEEGFLLEKNCKDRQLFEFVELAEEQGKLDQILNSIISIRTEG